MSIQPVKGTRDVYPAEMRLRNYIMDAWRRVSLRAGFEEYDAPIFEYLELFTIKSGDEIAEQLFNFTDRGERDLAIRAEITPSLARMVNAKVNALPRPIKWFSMPRVCRAEKPQRGRLREFFQWNIDIIGVADVLADAECIAVCADLLRELKLEPADVQVRIGSRPLTVAAIESTGVAPDRVEAVLPVLDKRPKVTDEEFADLCKAAGLDDAQVRTITAFQDAADIPAARAALGDCPAAQPHLADLEALWQHLQALGVADFCTLDLRIVRGLAYYTGIVYEVFDAESTLRAVAGGGRYDNLLQVLGGPAVPATGVGMGDVVLGILLEEKGKLPAELSERAVQAYVIDDGDEAAFAQALRVVRQLRSRDIPAEYSFKRQNVGKQMKLANRAGARTVIIARPDAISVKDMATGEQTDYDTDAFFDQWLARQGD